MFGFGMAANIAPWLNDLLLFIRPVDKSTLLALAANIRVPGDKWKGERVDRSDRDDAVSASCRRSRSRRRPRPRSASSAPRSTTTSATS